MKLANPFPQHKREVFYELRYKCWECGMNGQKCGGTELHHIRGRISSSVFNGAVLCKDHHKEIGHTFEEEKKYLKKTKIWIDILVKKREYKLDKEDEMFLADNKKYYE